MLANITESKIRRELERHGTRLEKMPARNRARQIHGVGYMVIDAQRNAVVMGANHRPWDATLDEIAEYIGTLV